jgi:ABC-type dipeptide/oligopeptide/nickel transport system permease subunit
MQKAVSYQQQLWHNLRKNKGAIFGLCIILLAVFISIFGYSIAPDNSPNADFQTVEIQAKKPGFTQLFLKITQLPVAEQSFFTTLLQGKPANYKLLPINSYQIHHDSIWVNKFIDDDTSEVIGFSLASIIKNNTIELKHSYIVRKTFWLGTDKFGRDILSRLIIGTRVSVAVGCIAVLISLLVGIVLGAYAGYYQGLIDKAIMWFVNVTWSIPTLLLVFAITLALGKGFWQIFIAVGLTMWVSVARLVRGQVIAIKQLEYVQAAKALGFTNARIIFRHILPNITGPLLVVAASNFATSIIIEAGLSFLGIGIQPPQPSWGLMIKEHYNFIITNNPFLAIVPGLAIMLLVLAFNLLGNGLRDAVDVKNR